MTRSTLLILTILSLMTMCMDLATPDTNMPPCQDIEQCIEGEDNKENTKYKWLLIQKDKRLKKHQPKGTIMHPNQHFEGRKKLFFSSENYFPRHVSRKRVELVIVVIMLSRLGLVNKTC